MPLSQNGGRKYPGYFKKMRTACQTYMKTKKKFVEIGAVMA